MCGKNLDLKTFIEVTQFYFVVGLIAVEKGLKAKEEIKMNMDGVTKLDSFDKKYFYDNLICNYLDVDSSKEGTPTRDEFEMYQCIGCDFLKNWISKEGNNYTSPLERFCGLWDELGL